jgi:hypothetical protein
MDACNSSCPLRRCSPRQLAALARTRVKVNELTVEVSAASCHPGKALGVRHSCSPSAGLLRNRNAKGQEGVLDLESLNFDEGSELTI